MADPVARKEPEVAVSYTLTLLDAAEAAGIERAWLLGEVGLDEATLTDPDARVPFALQEAIWQHALRAAGDGDFGLLVGRCCRPGSFSLLGYLAMNSATVGDALDAASRYQNLVGEGGRVEVRYQGDAVHVLYSPLNAHKPVTHHRVTAVLAAWQTFGRWIAGSGFTPRAVALTQPEAVDPARYREHFGVWVSFGVARGCLTLPREAAATPVLQANAELHRMLSGRAERMLRRLSEPGTTRNRVGDLLARRLTAGEPDKAGIARALGCSVSTLQRRLAAEGTSFTQLLNDTRLYLAREYLGRSDLSIGDIAFMLGFSEASAFYRAFRQWTGTTPGDYRELLLNRSRDVSP